MPSGGNTERCGQIRTVFEVVWPTANFADSWPRLTPSDRRTTAPTSQNGFRRFANCSTANFADLWPRRTHSGLKIGYPHKPKSQRKHV